MRIQIYNGSHGIVMGSTLTAGYVIQSYSMGTPDIGTEDPKLAGFSQAVRHQVVDSIDIAVVGGSREQVRNQVDKLYLVLRQAVDYWSDNYGKPVFLSALPIDSARPVYATIVMFKFHDLPDPSDTVNTSTINLNLAITRRLWSSVPPQPLPFRLVDYKGGEMSDADKSDLHLRSRLTPINTAIHNGIDLNMTLPDDTDESFAVLSNSYRFGAINTIAQPGTSTNIQPTSYTSPYTIQWSATSPNLFFGNQGRFATAPLGLVMRIGTKSIGVSFLDVYQSYRDETAATLNTWRKVIDPDLIKHNAHATYEGAGYIGAATTDTYGEEFLTYRHPNPPVTGINNSYGFWIKLAASGIVTQLPVQENQLIYCPWSPYIDISAIGGAMDMPLRLAIRFLSRWDDEPDTTDDYVTNRRFASDLIVASSHSPNDAFDPDVHEPGFYNWRELNDQDNAYTVVQREVRVKPQGDPQSPSGQGYRVPLGEVHDVGIGEYFSTQYGHRFVDVGSMVYGGWNSGTYRIFLRYRIDSLVIPWPPSFLNMRLNIGPYTNGGEFMASSITTRVHSHPFSVTGTAGASAMSAPNKTINAADFGVVEIPKSQGIGQKNQITLQVSTDMDWDNFAANANFLTLYDLVVLPVNNYFQHYTGSHTGKAVKTTSGGEIWQRNSEALYIDGFSPKGTHAYVIDEVQATPSNAWAGKTLR